ncbi:hypothetical protein K439DRAFT_1626780 [Ramaria rubella]|nr:hypothetical protein K439DRAFT_1626780 [Ramaria rubella]
MLHLLRKAQLAFPDNERKTGPPLEFDLDVLERLPTVDELQDIYCLLNESSWSVFFASQTPKTSIRVHPTSARRVLDIVESIRQQEITKVKQGASVGATVAEHEAAEFSEVQLDPTKPIPLRLDHPLFGTESFKWPLLTCWDKKEVMLGGNMKFVSNLLKKLANDRDGKIVLTPAKIKEEKEAAFRATWRYSKEEVSPEEDDTLKWFNESQKPAKKLF